MRWWEKRRHVLVREKARLAARFPGNNFAFVLRENSLWVTGTLLDFFQFECKYPDSYPFAPPQIYPRDRQISWVPRHQYVKDGRFCLDIREKTWNSTLSAADIIESLKTLLLAENARKAKGQDRLSVSEEDEPSQLQRKLSKLLFVLPSDIEFPVDRSFGTFECLFLVGPDTFRGVVSGIRYDDKSIESPLVKKVWYPQRFSLKAKGAWIETSLKSIAAILHTDKFDKLEQLLAEKKLIPGGKALGDFLGKAELILILLFDRKYRGDYFSVWCNREKNKAEPYRVHVLDATDLFDRIPNKGDCEVLRRRKVTIIGCGSGGSKVAEYMAKAGVMNFVLVDGDILTTQNIMRHACQLEDVSLEKVYAVKNRLCRINPQIEVTPIVKYLHVIDPSTDKAIKASDLIIVATASNEELFNEYAYSLGIPAIYPRVYRLGFGGEVLRIVPGVTPCFECSYCQKEVLIEEQFKGAVFPGPQTTSYDRTSNGQQIPMPALAADADFVALITAKMGLEVLLKDEVQSLKDTANIILWGNTNEWIFDQEYQCLKIGNANLRSLENCIVCHGSSVIADELGMSAKQVEDVYADVVSQIRNGNAKPDPD